MSLRDMSPGAAALVARAASDRASNRPAATSTRRRPPYAVERHPATAGSILLIGFDGRGDVMVELRLPVSRFSAGTIDRMRRWMMQNDDATPPVTLVP